MTDYDVCIIGSGAGAGPVAYELAKAGKSVVILEKGPWFKESDFTKDEINCCRRSTYTPLLKDEPQVIEELEEEGWQATSNRISGWDFWNGNMVGGSSNLMSGFFHRMKPIDFRLLSEFGPVKGANIIDWPISYDELEPYYTKVEELVGVSGKVVSHPFLEPRTSDRFPFEPTLEHPISTWFDKACDNLGYYSIPIPRAILSKPMDKRNGCAYTGYCGSYGCTTKAKGSSRAALIDPAVETGNCTVLPFSKAYKIETDHKGNASYVRYYSKDGKKQKVSAKIFVVACQAVESARLLLVSEGSKHKNGIGNNFNQVGKNLVFSAGGIGGAEFHKSDMSDEQFADLKLQGPFMNRALQDWYVINDSSAFDNPVKGGTIDFLLEHSNPIRRANKQKWDGSSLLWGKALQDKLTYTFRETRKLQFEVFCDWLPNDNCFVGIDGSERDKWGTPVSKLRIGAHQHDIKVGEYIASKGEQVLKEMGGRGIYSSISSSPPSNLMAGGCRFGINPEDSVLDSDCRVHDAENVFVTDGSFMPTGGSVTYTWTIYANSFRVADKIKAQL